MSYADLYTTLSASLCWKTPPQQRATIGLFWANTRPAEVSLAVRCGDDYEVWNVGRSLFIAAAQDWARGSWIGGGDFAVCYSPTVVLLAFKPAGGPHAVAFVDREKLGDFIEHTQRIVPPGEAESRVTLERVDEALRRIFDQAGR